MSQPGERSNMLLDEEENDTEQERLERAATLQSATHFPWSDVSEPSLERQIVPTDLTQIEVLTDLLVGDGTTRSQF